MELRESASPVPAQTMLVSPGAIASALTVDTFSWSKTGVHVTPAFTERHSPPEAKPTSVSLGLRGLPITALTRPLMLAGPTERHGNAERTVVSGYAACATAGTTGTISRSEDSTTTLRMATTLVVGAGANKMERPRRARPAPELRPVGPAR